MRTMFLMIAILSTACSSEIDGKTAAEVKDVAEKTPAAEVVTPPAAGSTLKAVPEASKIEFVGAKVTGDHTGSFGKIDGVGKLEGGALVSTRWTVDMTTLEADHPKLTTHLKTADFFDVEQFPSASFESTAIKATGGDPSHEITGRLTMKGVTKEVVVPATVDVTPEGATVKSEFTIKRFDWNIEYKGKADDLIKDEVLLKVDVALK